jgi:NADH:ubiquinone oxidoreductase subunit
MTTLITRVTTWLQGERVGTDGFGNRYYQERTVPTGRRRRRWVVYKQDDDASRVPPSWHAWLHYTTNDIPKASDTKTAAWQKDHQPNLTGTAAAYRPPGHTLEGGKRAPATGDYEPWRPV